MNEREILTYAAIACGIERDLSMGGDGFDSAGNLVASWDLDERWNPINNDADCFRMECALALHVCVVPEAIFVTDMDSSLRVTEFIRDHNKQTAKARRYASSLLAARIGKDLARKERPGALLQRK